MIAAVEFEKYMTNASDFHIIVGKLSYKKSQFW